MRYKCRVREPWWAVPLPKHGAPALFLTYCSSEYPRLVLNEAEVLHTNTVHGVSLRQDMDPRALAAGFYNSLTLLSAELVGRSYGGGVLKLEPTEAEALLVPPVPDSAGEHLEQVDALLRLGELTAVLDLMDRLVLVEGLGLSEHEVMALRGGAERLRSRRRARGKAPKVGKPGGVHSGQLAWELPKPSSTSTCSTE
jgi:adenine-specific DNA methylase